MRVKTSITIPAELLAQIDKNDSNRSVFFERASRAYLAKMERARREREDIEIINRNADRLNREAKDVLNYQGLP
jgi:metal-responsive CopG/Arc/MetJ family transcriptional regulator